MILANGMEQKPYCVCVCAVGEYVQNMSEWLDFELLALQAFGRH